MHCLAFAFRETLLDVLNHRGGGNVRQEGSNCGMGYLSEDPRAAVEQLNESVAGEELPSGWLVDVTEGLCKNLNRLSCLLG